MASRVVPGRSCTMARSSPISRLNSVDLPALGRPTSTTEYAAAAAAARPWPGCSGAIPSGPSPAGGPQRPDSEPACSRRATTSSSRSPVPRPCSALTWWGAPRPRPSSSQTESAWFGWSILLATTSTGTPAEYSTLATCSSSEVTPTAASTTNSTASASRTARSAWALTLASSSSPLVLQPPVSSSVKRRPCHSASTALRSRVTPGCSSTIASRRPRMRFTSVDLPTLGRPTTATTGFMATPAPVSAPARGWRPPPPRGEGPAWPSRRGSGPG